MTFLSMTFVCCIFFSAMLLSGDSPVMDVDLGFSTGPKVGEKIPEFELPDQHGEMKNINDLIGENGAILNFYRSASW